MGRHISERLLRHLLMARLRADVELAVHGGLDVEASGRLLQFYEDGLSGYTYLEERR
jgi:arginine decarboxylase